MPRAKPTPAAAVPLPATLEPQLATLVDRAPPGDWLYELKLDGYRMLARVGGPSDVRLITRRGNDWTHRMPTLHKALLAARLPSGWFDGEIIVPDAEGKPSFNRLQLAMEGRDNAAIVFYLFDAPFLHGRDLRSTPVEARRDALREVLPASDRLRFSETIDAPIPSLLNSACELGLEGVIGKRRGSLYLGRRSDDWIKLKCTRRQEFVIGGYTWPDESRNDPGLGALLVGYRDQAGVLQYAGKVGAGFTGEGSAALRRRLDAIAQPRRPFATATGHDTHAQWVRPELVCEVAFNEWPEGGALRHASFKGLREDKPAAAVTREQPASTAPARRASPALQRELARVTHPDRVIDASTGITKLELATFYAEVAPWLLPHLRDRHAYVVRFAGGLSGKRIFQQHPEGVRGFKGTPQELWPGHEPALRFDDRADLVNAAQHEVIEFHTWNSTAAAIGLPDRMIFDLDPGEGVAWAQVRQGAELVRVMLGELGLQSWVKTTGGKGLHVVVPLLPEFDYPAVKGFSYAVVQHLAHTLPQLFVARSGAGHRVGRIFIDYLRNGQSQSTATAFSARARPGMGVSMPIAWEELGQVASGDHWTVRSALQRLRTLKKDPWAGYARRRQSLAQAIVALGSQPLK